VQIGVNSNYFITTGKKLLRKSAARGSKQQQFRDALEGAGYDWTGRDADHVRDLAFEGPDAFDNLWPLDSNRNRWAYTEQWYKDYGIEYKDNSGTKKTGTLYNLGGKYLQVIGFATRPRALGGRGKL
jgi:hypothetical protein